MTRRRTTSWGTSGTSCWPATPTPPLRLRRADRIERVLIEQMDVLETMTPHDFLAFRASLAPASGVPVGQIGTKSGTGGSTGAPYLRSRLGLRRSTPSSGICGQSTEMRT